MVGFIVGVVGVGMLLGAAILKLLEKFWDSIADWLNNTAADVVQKYIGYDARKAMQKAVCKADRVMDKIRNVSQVYYRSNPLATHYDKVTMEVTAPTYEFDEKFLETINEKRVLTQDMKYEYQP